MPTEGDFKVITQVRAMTSVLGAMIDREREVITSFGGSNANKSESGGWVALLGRTFDSDLRTHIAAFHTHNPQQIKLKSQQKRPRYQL
jgi:hypothetical protein